MLHICDYMHIYSLYHTAWKDVKEVAFQNRQAAVVAVSFSNLIISQQISS